MKRPVSHRKAHTLDVLMGLVVAAIVGGTVPAQAATFTVNSTDDAVDVAIGDGMCLTAGGACTLRAAIQEANALAGTDAISLPAGEYVLRITGTEEAAARGDLDILDILTITGAGAGTTIVDGNQIGRVFHVLPGAQATITGITIQNGKTIYDGGGIYNSGMLTVAKSTVRGNTATHLGGGIYNSSTGSVTLSESIVTLNAGAHGGGIYNDHGVLLLINSTVSSNTANINGGGIQNYYGIATLSGSTVTGNTATNSGGGIHNYGYGSGGQLTITNSTISWNMARAAGGVNSESGGSHTARAKVTITNSTISGNTASRDAGGLSVAGTTMYLNNVTITNNIADSDGDGRGNGGGILACLCPKEIYLTNTIIAGNTDRGGQNPDCGGGGLDSQGFNLIGNAKGCSIQGDPTGNITGEDPMLGPLANNGGSTETHALLGGSPAIDAGNPALPGTGGNACASLDQRGMARPVDGDIDRTPTCDIGAVEMIAEGAPPISVILPNRAGNRGSIIAVVYGNGFMMEGATVKLLRAGEGEIVGTPVTVGGGGTVAVTVFDLTGKLIGSWDVVVTNPNGSSATLPQGFTIEEERTPELWIDILGRNQIPVGRPGLYRILVGNRGNVNALGVPLALGGIPRHVAVSPRFQIAPPPPQEGQVPTDWSQVPITVVSDEFPDHPTIVLFLPVVPAGFTVVLELTLTAPFELLGSEFEMLAAGVPPYLQPTPDPEVVALLTQGARTYALRAFGVEVPPEKLPRLEQYLTASLQSAVKRGVNTWIENLGTKGEVYSLNQLLFDLAQFAVERDPEVTDFECRDHLGGIVVRIPGTNTGICKPFGPGTHYRMTFVPVRITGPLDPNGKVGAQGVGDARYLSDEEPLAYAIYFENLETATATAQEVVITDQLDVGKMDLNTFSLGPIAFGDRRVTPPPGLRDFTTHVDLRPDQDLTVRIDANLNPDTGLFTLRLGSIDPNTLQLPEDPLAGFLPPNITPPAGEGSVLLTIRPKQDLSTGTEIRNQATIKFDMNPPMVTPEWLNTLDNTKPESQVQPLATYQSATSFAVQWSGNDVGSGILDYMIFVSEDGGPFIPWLLNSTATSATFTGQLGKAYAFYSVARDHSGNVESVPPIPDTNTMLAGPDSIPPTTAAVPSPFPNAAGWNNSNVTLTLTAIDNEEGSGVKEMTYSTSGAQVIPPTIVAGASTSLPILNEGQTTVTFFATDNAGNTEQARTIVLNLDRTPPTITPSQVPGPNGNGWNSTEVMVSFTCADGLSGLAAGSPPADRVVASEGSGQQVTGTCQDLAGNSASVTVSDINIDKTPPNPPMASVSPAPSANGWNNAPVVTVRLTSNGDAGPVQSGGVTCTGPTFLTAETAATVVSGTCTDLAGNLSAAASVTVRIDRTAPVVMVRRDPDSNSFGWNNTDVRGRFEATDTLSGIQGTSFADVAFTQEGANQSVTWTFTDRAGNSASALLSGISIDKSPPGVACSVNPNTLWPPNRKMVAVTASVTVTDALSGSGGFTLTSVTSSESDGRLDDGDLPDDIHGFDNGTPDTGGLLRAERSGSGNGRLYTLIYAGRDVAGNSGVCSTTVSVPHDQRKK